LRDSILYVISCIRHPVPQESDKIHILYARKFCRTNSGVVILRQSRYSASIKRVLVYISRCVNIKNAIIMAPTMTSCSTAIRVVAAESVLQTLHL